MARRSSLKKRNTLRRKVSKRNRSMRKKKSLRRKKGGGLRGWFQDEPRSPSQYERYVSGVDDFGKRATTLMGKDMRELEKIEKHYLGKIRNVINARDHSQLAYALARFEDVLSVQV